MTGPVFTGTLTKVQHIKKPNAPQNKPQPVLVAVVQPHGVLQHLLLVSRGETGLGPQPGQGMAPAGPGPLQCFPQQGRVLPHRCRQPQLSLGAAGQD